MSLEFSLPFSITPQDRVLMVGCGGGYDIVWGLPVALAAKQQGAQVFLSSYTFRSQGSWLDR